MLRSERQTDVIDTLVKHAPAWLIQFPAVVTPDQRAMLQREIHGATRERMVRELCGLLEVVTEATALILVLEDLHWVDRSTLDALSAIGRRPEPARLLVLGTLRPADLILSDNPLKTLKQDLILHRLSAEIALERLEESDVAEFWQRNPHRTITGTGRLMNRPSGERCPR